MSLRSKWSVGKAVRAGLALSATADAANAQKLRAGQVKVLVTTPESLTLQLSYEDHYCLQLFPGA